MGKLLLLLAFALRLSRMLMRRLRFGLCVAGMLLGFCMIALAMLLGGGPMRLGSLFVLISRLLVHVLWHEITPLRLGLVWTYVRSPAVELPSQLSYRRSAAMPYVMRTLLPWTVVF